MVAWSPPEGGPGTPGGTPERPALFFADADEWASWLAIHQATERELWMGLRKKHVQPRGLTWPDAVVEALRFGWIDSVAQRIDDDAIRQRWTPRRRSSVSSAVNLATVQRLIAEGRMEPAGLAIYEARDPLAVARAQGRPAGDWPAAYQQQLDANPLAKGFWELASDGYRRQATDWVMSAKREATQQRRMTTLVQCCATGRLVPPLVYPPEPRWASRAREQLGIVAPEPD